MAGINAANQGGRVVAATDHEETTLQNKVDFRRMTTRKVAKAKGAKQMLGIQETEDAISARRVVENIGVDRRKAKIFKSRAVSAETLPRVAISRMGLEEDLTVLWKEAKAVTVRAKGLEEIAGFKKTGKRVVALGDSSTMAREMDTRRIAAVPPSAC